jgi:hypothetical protein
MSNMDMHALALEGAKIRLAAIEEEKAALHAAFPQIAHERRNAALRDNLMKARAAKALKAVIADEAKP